MIDCTERLTYDQDMHREPCNDNDKHENYDELVGLEQQLNLKPQKQLRRAMRRHLVYNDLSTEYTVANMMFVLRFERNLRHQQALERREEIRFFNR